MFTLLRLIRALLAPPAATVAAVNPTLAVRVPAPPEPTGRPRAEILAELAALAPLRRGRYAGMAEAIADVIDHDLEQLASHD